tara:strand:- start:1098 stop:2033 length:936 start_codon:yes stop_codon:yes gene_type:complete
MKDLIHYLQSKNHAPSTQKAYLINIELFLKWTDKEIGQTTKKDVLKYLEHLRTERSQCNITRRNSLIALNHYFAFLLKTEQISTDPTALIKIRGAKKRMLYRTYTPEELEQLCDNFHHRFVRNFDDNHIPKNQRQNSFLSRNRNAVMLGFLIHQGVTPRETERMLLQDIDLAKATVKIRGGKRGVGRTLNLKATQIGQLMHYLNEIRPQFFTCCKQTERLFFSLPASGQKTTESENLMYTFKPLKKQVKTIDRNFLNFQQIRASVITAWLKTEGLRKAQYFAGHRNINATEEYRPNQIEGLTEDITKFNPF